MLLTYDGLDFWENVDWDLITLQPTNDDDGFDETDDNVLPESAQQRVEVWIRADEFDVVPEMDEDIYSKRKSLIDHLGHRYATGLLRWPKRFSNIQRLDYNLANELV